MESNQLNSPNGLAMKSSGIETLNFRMRRNLNRIINLTVSSTTAIFYSRCYLPFLSLNYE